MSHFYLSLPSNSSKNYYPDNTLTKFTTKLPTAIALQGEWEVGLAEIILPKNWINVNEGQSFTVHYYLIEELYLEHNSETKTEYIATFPLKPGRYVDVKSLLEEINKLLDTYYEDVINSRLETWVPERLKNDGWIRFTHNSWNETVEIDMLSCSKITMTDDLADILGFNKTSLPFRNNSTDIRICFRSDRMCDIDFGRHSLYVYCDILEYVPVGDTMAPLLRTIDVTSANKIIIHKSFDRPRYVPLQKLQFETLEVDIRDGFGNPVPFESGTLIVTLHFRRANSPYFVL